MRLILEVSILGISAAWFAAALIALVNYRDPALATLLFLASAVSGAGMFHGPKRR